VLAAPKASITVHLWQEHKCDAVLRVFGEGFVAQME